MFTPCPLCASLTQPGLHFSSTPKLLSWVIRTDEGQYTELPSWIRLIENLQLSCDGREQGVTPLEKLLPGTIRTAAQIPTVTANNISHISQRLHAQVIKQQGYIKTSTRPHMLSDSQHPSSLLAEVLRALQLAGVGRAYWLFSIALSSQYPCTAVERYKISP